MKNGLKIFSIIAILVVLFIMNSFVGNPISKELVRSSADKYLDKNYSDINFEKSEVVYNFVNRTYTVFVQDKKSIDNKFEIGFDSLGRLKYDTSSDILFNTFIRYEEFIKKYGKQIENRENTNYEINLSIADEDYHNKIKLNDEINIDKFPFNVDANIYAFAEEPSYDLALANLKNLMNILDKEPLNINNYSIILVPEKDRAKNNEAQSWANALTIFDIPSDFMKKSSVEDLKKHQEKMHNAKI